MLQNNNIDRPYFAAFFIGETNEERENKKIYELV